MISSTWTVFFDTEVFLRTITFDSEYGYAVAGRGSLSLVQGTAAGSPSTTIQVDSGEHEFQLCVNFETDTVVNVASSKLLEFKIDYS